MIKNVAIITGSGKMVDFYEVALTELVDERGDRRLTVYNEDLTKVVAEFYNPDAILDLDCEETCTVNSVLSEIANEEQSDEL